MIFVCFKGTTEAFHFDAADNVGHFAFVEEGWSRRGEEGNELVEFEHGGPKIAFEFGFASKYDQREKVIVG